STAPSPTTNAASAGEALVSEVAALQAALVDRGHDPGPVDGVMGPKTARALAAWQRTEGLEPTGVLDDASRRALLGVESGAQSRGQSEVASTLNGPEAPTRPRIAGTRAGARAAPTVSSPARRAPGGSDQRRHQRAPTSDSATVDAGSTGTAPTPSAQAGASTPSDRLTPHGRISGADRGIATAPMPAPGPSGAMPAGNPSNRPHGAAPGSLSSGRPQGAGTLPGAGRIGSPQRGGGATSHFPEGPGRNSDPNRPRSEDEAISRAIDALPLPRIVPPTWLTQDRLALFLVGMMGVALLCHRVARRRPDNEQTDAGTRRQQSRTTLRPRTSAVQPSGS
ncbi:MAG: peptidoglycan-binding protein, partial [Pseudomonadota bacterium]